MVREERGRAIDVVTRETGCTEQMHPEECVEIVDGQTAARGCKDAVHWRAPWKTSGRRPHSTEGEGDVHMSIVVREGRPG